MRKLSRVLLCIGILAIVIVSISYVRVSLGKLVRHNWGDVSMLVLEMLTEAGPDFTKAIGDHLVMLDSYTAHMEKNVMLAS